MTNALFPRALKAVFDLRAKDRVLSSEEHAAGKLALPTLDQRIDLYSRAVHGPNYTMMLEEREAVRDRILDTMADEAVHAILIAANELETRDNSPRLGIDPVIGEKIAQELSHVSLCADPVKPVVAACALPIFTSSVDQALATSQRVRQDQRFSLGNPRSLRAAYAVTVALALILVAGTGIWTVILKFVHSNGDTHVQVSSTQKSDRLDPAGNRLAEVTRPC